MTRSQLRARTTLLVAGLALAASGAGASVAAANPGPTGDQGLTGACNMTNTKAQYGMFAHAAAPQGMINALLRTNGGIIPENCTGPSSPPPRP